MAIYNNLTPWRRLCQATSCSVTGLRAALHFEQAFRYELLVLIPLLPAAVLLGNTGVERALLIGSWLLVMIVELLNSAVEAVCDRIGLEHHVLLGRAKDQGSAAVMVSIGLAIVTWVLILWLD